MTLYEYLKMSEDDFDTYDTTYDAVVTVCYIADEDECDNYDKFCNGIIKKVNVIHIDTHYLTVDWTEMIMRNIDKFKAFTKENWRENCQYENDIDEFVYQWINEIHLYMAGYVDEDTYAELNKLVDSLE